MDQPSRRDFIGVLAAAGVTVPGLAAQERRGTIPDKAPFEDPLRFVRSDAPVKAEPFPMTQVRLLAGPFASAAEWNRGYLERLGEDRLLRNFRINAGMDSSAKPLGGWERDVAGNDGELRGHFVGHYLSACALTFASTGDQRIKAKGDSIVAELAKCHGLGWRLQAGSMFPVYLQRLDLCT